MLEVLFCEGVSWAETALVLTQDPWVLSPAGLRSVGRRWEERPAGTVRGTLGFVASLPSGREVWAAAV